MTSLSAVSPRPSTPSNEAIFVQPVRALETGPSDNTQGVTPILVGEVQKSLALREIFASKESAAIELRREKVKKELAALKRLTFEEMRSYQCLLGMEKAADVLKLCISLTYLNLSNSSISNEELKELLPKCGNLTSLNLADCGELTDDGVIAAKACKQLISLNLAFCYKTTDKAIIPIAAACPNLAFLNVAHCNRLTDAGIKALDSHNLVYLDIRGCFRIKTSRVCPLFFS